MDTLRLRGPATDDLLELLPNRRFTQMVDDDTGEIAEFQRGGWTAVPVGHTWVRVIGDQRRGAEVAIEFSAPSVLRGSNLHPLGLGLLDDVAETVWHVLTEEFEGFPAFDQLRLTRLDVDRDFTGVNSIADTLHAVSHRPAARARTDCLARGQGGEWQSLTRGNRQRWLAVGYNKAKQMSEAAQKLSGWRQQLLLAQAEATHGVLRWELQLRRERLMEYGISKLSDVTEEAVYRMSRDHFDRTRFGDVLAGGSERVRAALAPLSHAQQRGVMSLLLADAHGLPAPMSRNLEDSYRSLAQTLRLAPVDILGQNPGEARRLDFDSGEEKFGHAVGHAPAEIGT